MAKHEETHIDSELPYEENVVGMRGIVYFGIGLFLLIVVTFGLMWIFQYRVMQPEMERRDAKNRSPMAMSKEDRMPKGMQLQSAPGFGVDDPRTGERINLELREPQAEYRELQKIWEDQWENGEKDEKTGTVISLSIKEAKEKFLADTNVKAKTGEEAEKALEEASSIVSAASSGRTRTDIIR